MYERLALQQDFQRCHKYLFDRFIQDKSDGDNNVLFEQVDSVAIMNWRGPVLGKILDGDFELSPKMKVTLKRIPQGYNQRRDRIIPACESCSFGIKVLNSRGTTCTGVLRYYATGRTMVDYRVHRSVWGQDNHHFEASDNDLKMYYEILEACA